METIPEDNVRVAVAETYRGVGIFAGQSRERIDAIVKPAIDAVAAESRVLLLVPYAADPASPPEGRLFASAKIEAIHEMAAADRVQRPDVDLDKVRASVTGLASAVWFDPRTHRSLLDAPPGAAVGEGTRGHQ